MVGDHCEFRAGNGKDRKKHVGDISCKGDEPRQEKWGDTPYGVVAAPQSGMGFVGRVCLWHPLFCLTIWMKMFQAGLNWWSTFLLKLPHGLIS